MTDTASAPEIVRFCRDETCPSCGWPETYTAADTSTSPIVAARIGCSKCGWTAPPARVWQLQKVDAGDWLLLSNDKVTLWRFRLVEERDGTVERGDGSTVHGDFWTVLRFRHEPARLMPDDFDHPWDPDVWEVVAEMLPRRQDAIDAALTIDGDRLMAGAAR